MPDDGANKPDWSARAVKWIGGATAVLVALAGLRAAWVGLFPPSPDPPKPPVVHGGSTPEPAKLEEPKPTSLPTAYRSDGHRLWAQGDDWFEKDTKTGTLYQWARVSRNAAETVLRDAGRGMFLRWPSGGGVVQWSAPPATPWTTLYEVTPE